MDTKRGRILFVGGFGRDRHHYTLANNTFTTVTLTGTEVDAVATTEKGGMVYVADLDLFLVRRFGAGGAVYMINPETFEANPYPTTGGTSIPATRNGPYNKFLYVPRLGGIIYVPTYGGNAWFLRVR
jgi:hypothetical protein